MTNPTYNRLIAIIDNELQKEGLWSDKLLKDIKRAFEKDARRLAKAKSIAKKNK